MSERTPIRDPRQFTSLLQPHPLDFRSSSQWVYRYSPESRPHWQEKANRLHDLYHGDEAIARRLFLMTPPKEKKQLVELISYFGVPEDSDLASGMIASSMQMYSDPGSGTAIPEQRAFYEGELTTTPDIFLHALDMYFDSIRQNEQAEEFMEMTLSIRINADPQKDPRLEQGFLLKQLNATEGRARLEHYLQNQDMYAFFGLTYDEEKGRLQKGEKKYTPPIVPQRVEVGILDLIENGPR